MDFLDITPQQEQQLMAQALRAKQLLGENAQQANRFGTLSAVAQLANNPAVAQAAMQADKNARAQYDTQSLGQQGFALPGQGEFVESPVYSRERMATRNQQEQIQRAGLAAAAQAQADRLAAQQQLQGDKLQAQRDRDQHNSMLRMTLAQMAGQPRMGAAQIAADSRGAQKADAPVGKTLPAGQVEKLTKNQTAAGNYENLADSFKDEWAGSPLLANAQNAMGRFVGAGYEDQANWWQRYQSQTNEVRNQLFGSALTMTERDAFDRANVVPGMKASEIKKRLGQQAEAAAKAARKLTENYGKAGYNVAGFLEQAAPAAAQQAPAGTSKKQPTAAELGFPPGFEVVGVR
jgi:hypothetical protein